MTSMTKYRMFFISQRTYLVSFTMRAEGVSMTRELTEAKGLLLTRGQWDAVQILVPACLSGTLLVKG